MMKVSRLFDYIKGNTKSVDEVSEIMDWLEKSDSNQKQYNRLKNLWVLNGLDQQSQTSAKFFKSNRPSPFLLSHQWVRYAAIFVLAYFIGALSLYFINGNQADVACVQLANVIEVPKGEKSMVTLYDGTKVWLNAGTKFRYPAMFDDKNRTVELDGEAWFEVAKNEHQPFIVKSGQIQVKVLGTKFNVFAYSEEDIIETTLEEGSVSISMDGTSKQFILKPDTQFQFFKSTNQYQVKTVETELYSSWKDNILRFEDDELGDIFKQMERWYDVKFEMMGDVDLKERYTITVKTESLREILQVLSITSKIDYEIYENEVRISQ